jgi:hypothetical protein
VTVEEVLIELRRLDRQDKLRAMQVLVTELAAEETGGLVHGGQYEVWSPTDAAEAAEALTRALEQDSRHRAAADA